MATKPQQASPLQKQQQSWTPPPIKSLEDTGLTHGFLTDMILKYMYIRGQVTGMEIAKDVALPFLVIQPILEFIKRERMCEVAGAGGLGAAAWQFVITGKGIERAREQMERTSYVGAAPVPWDEYVKAIKLQRSARIRVNESIMNQALSHLVLDKHIFSKIGPAVNSGKSIFLYGPPGNGKTTIAESVGRIILGGDMFIPYAVEVDGQVIKVFDDINHIPVESEEDMTATNIILRQDIRWIKIRRPVIMVGGELVMEGLELAYDPVNKFYEAPFQLKANGGMFLIDDFGRQQIRPRDLLNRWIVPMEKNVDFLSLNTGQKLKVPFEVLIVFSTNLPPGDLVDEAFLRRIRHKIEVSSPSVEHYIEIFKKVCQARNIAFNDQAIKYLLQEYYINKKRKLRANHPRDLVDQLMDIAVYRGLEPQLSKDLIDSAADSYFVDL